MLEFDIWLLSATLIVLCVQGAKLNSFASPLALAITCASVIGICTICADVVASQSLVTWQQLAQSQLQTVQILLLLEVSLACFAGLKVLPISLSCALLYGELWFFQQGMVDSSFILQSAIFSAAACAIMLASFYLTKVEQFWPTFLFIILLISTVFMSASLPKQTQLPTINWFEVTTSISVLLLFIGIGSAWQQFYLFKKKS